MSNGYKFFHADFRTPIEEIKRQYLKLAMENHPDRGGSTEAMQAINAEYERLNRSNGHIHEGADGGVYEDLSDNGGECPEEFLATIDALMDIPGITIEVIGKFVWVGGDTYPSREQLKAIGMRWSKRRGMWYKAPEGYKARRSNKTLDEIRATYGSRFQASTDPKPERKRIA